MLGLQDGDSGPSVSQNTPGPPPAQDQEKGLQGPAPGDVPGAWVLLCPGSEKVENTIRKQLHGWTVLCKGTEEGTGM